MADANDLNRRVIEEFRATGGEVEGMASDVPLLLLHTTGARTGLPRVNPLTYQRVGDRFAVFATNMGAPANPAWYHNLRANRDVTIEVGTETIAVTAATADAGERQQIWETQKQRDPHLAGFEQTAERIIPVVLLTPRS